MDLDVDIEAKEPDDKDKDGKDDKMILTKTMVACPRLSSLQSPSRG